jgi:2,3-bisphosphoglycerate-dependent phosphoglycerate mutase
LTKYIEGTSDADIMGVEMATGQPVVYDLDEKLNIINKAKLYSKLI